MQYKEVYDLFRYGGEVRRVFALCCSLFEFLDSKEVFYSIGRNQRYFQLTITCKYENFIFSSIWNYRVRYPNLRYSRKSLICLLILLCGDVERCPGPNDRCLPELIDLLKSRGISMLHQNVRGLFTNLQSVQEILHDFETIDILTLSETHINTNTFNDEDNLYSIPRYTFIKKNRTNGHAGGVAMFISDRIKWKRRMDLEVDNVECLWIEIFQHKAKSFLLTSVYRPPDGSKYLTSNFNNTLDEILETVSSESKEIIMMGDINVNYIKKKDNRDIKSIFEL